MSSEKKIKEATLEFLQDLYTNGGFCQLTKKLEEGKRLKVLDDQVYSVYISDQTSKAARSGGNVATLLKNLHIATLFKIDDISEYFQGEYKPVSSDNDFINDFYAVWPEFFNAWYFKTVYIGYGEDLIEMEKASIRKNKLPYYEDKCKFFSKFRVYTKVQGEPGGLDEKGEYTSLLSGVTGLKIDSERLVSGTCNRGKSWIKWWHLAGEYNTGMQKFISSFEACIKRLSVIVTNREMFQWEIEQLKNNKIYLVKHKDQTLGINNNKDKPIEIVPVADVMQILQTHLSYFETQAAWMGFSGKGINQKASGVTPVESYQNLKLISNMQESNISKLNVLAHRMKKTFKGTVPEDFHFEISGQIMAEGLPGSMNSDADGGGVNDFNSPNKNVE